MLITANDVKQGSERTEQNERSREHYYTLIVRVDETGSPQDVLDAAAPAELGIPKLGATHPRDTFAILRKRVPRETDDVYTFEIDLEYSTNTRFIGFSLSGDGQSIDYSTDNPLLRPWEWRLGYTKETYAAVRGYYLGDTRAGTPDYSGGDLTALLQPITNSAYDLFDEPVQIVAPRMTLNISRFESWADFHPEFIDEFTDAVNRLPWQLTPTITMPARTAKCEGITAEAEWHSGYAFWKVDYSFIFNWGTWDQYILDEGMRKLTGDGTPSKPYAWATITQDGKNVAHPVPLDGTGQPLPRPTPGSPTIDGVYRVYIVNKLLDFGQLGLTISS